jgi:hypothetical protein
MGRPAFSGAVERPQDTAARAGAIDQFTGTVTAPANGTTNGILVTNNDDTDYVLELFTVGGADAGGNEFTANPGDVKAVVQDENDVAVFNTAMDFSHFPLPFDPGVVIEPDWDIGILVENTTASSVDIEASVIYRTE